MVCLFDNQSSYWIGESALCQLKQFLNRMHMRKILCLSVVLTLISLSVWAQRTVTGRVTDERNNPLPNVSILVKGTNSGTVSKEDGSFSLVVPNNAKTLVVSFTDMATREVD